MAELDGFLRSAEAKRFQDGVWDCCLFPADWVLAVTGIDGASPWRGRYHARIGWLRILSRDGGMLAVVERGAQIAGLSETTTPARGDIGVIETANGPVGAICLGERWAVASSRGLWVRRAACLKAWSVPNA